MNKDSKNAKDNINANKTPPQYKMPFFNRMCIQPKTDQELETIAHDLILWAQQDDSIVFGDFVAISGVHNTKLCEYAKRNHTLGEALIYAKQVVGSRRERGALTNKLNANIVTITMPLYDPEYRAWKKEMSQKEGASVGGIQYVLVDKMPDSPLVPTRKETEDEME
jgi:hypothetical protein